MKFDQSSPTFLQQISIILTFEQGYFKVLLFEPLTHFLELLIFFNLSGLLNTFEFVKSFNESNK